MKKEVLLLGESQLYQRSEEVARNELDGIKEVVKDLHDTLMAYREKYGAGRAIAASQIGVPKRLLYMHIEEPVIFINPILSFPSEEKMEVLDDCMSFPGLYVKVDRYRTCLIQYLDFNWEPQEMLLEGDLAELLQHEYDHLDGILATMRAKDNKSFLMKK